MADFGMETSGFDSTLSSLQDTNANVIAEVEGGTREFAEELLEEIRRTAPVDTGNYRDDWRIEEQGDYIFLVNTVPYGPHLVFPNSQFRGSPEADVPGLGILHNVRGIVHSRKSQMGDGIIARLRSLLG